MTLHAQLFEESLRHVVVVALINKPQIEQLGYSTLPASTSEALNALKWVLENDSELNVVAHLDACREYNCASNPKQIHVFFQRAF